MNIIITVTSKSVNYRHLYLDTVILLMENCSKFKKVRFLENWSGITEKNLMEFWNEIKANNIEFDAGEEDWKKVNN